MIVTPESRRSRTTCHMSLRNSTSTPAVGSSRNKICGSCDSALAISTRRFMPPDSVMILLSFLSQRECAQHFLHVGRIFRLVEQAAAERHGCPDALESVGVEFLRHQSDQRAGRAIVLDDVMAVDRDLALRGHQYAANNADQRGLAGSVRSQQRKYFTATDVEIDAAKRLESGRIAFRQVFDGNDRLHGGESLRRVQAAYRPRSAAAPAGADATKVLGKLRQCIQIR